MTQVLTKPGNKETDETNTVKCQDCGNTLSKDWCIWCDEHYNDGHKQDCPKIHGPRSDDHSSCAPILR